MNLLTCTGLKCASTLLEEATYVHGRLDLLDCPSDDDLHVQALDLHFFACMGHKRVFPCSFVYTVHQRWPWKPAPENQPLSIGFLRTPPHVNPRSWTQPSAPGPSHLARLHSPTAPMRVDYGRRGHSEVESAILCPFGIAVSF